MPTNPSATLTLSLLTLAWNAHPEPAFELPTRAWNWLLRRTKVPVVWRHYNFPPSPPMPAPLDVVRSASFSWLPMSI